MTRGRAGVARLAVGAGLIAGFAIGLPPCSTALAFKSGADFSKPAAAGGGGGFTFTGSPRYKHWNCAICHVDAPGQIAIHLEADPPDLLTSAAYRPGMSYHVTVRMLGEHRGLDAARNTNGMALTATDARNAPAGRFAFGDDLAQGNDAAELVTDGRRARLTAWAFTWSAPPAGTGRVTFHVALVDGDGAGDGVQSSSDPFGDDVAIGRIAFDEQTSR